MARIDLNSDLGEGFGAWTMGDDTEMLALVSSANIACGFHAGDPEGIMTALHTAAQHGTRIGAHIGYRDLAGFGRRDMVVGQAALYAETLYQIGALQALATAAATRVSYVKPHGALYNRMAFDLPLADVVIDAMQALDPKLALMALAGSPLVAHATARGLQVVQEIFADRGYLPDGQLVPRHQTGAVLHDPEVISARILHYLRTGLMRTVTGEEISLQGQSVCVHGDTAAAVAITRRLREDLTAAGVAITTFDLA